ncbi:MAG: SpoIIE family protein phosphatase [Clostridia bacterium]
MLQNGKIITINSINIPVGLISNSEYLPISKRLNNGDIIVQISDGVVKDDMNINDNYFTKILSSIDTNKNSKEIANELHKLLLKEYKNILNDDITIIVNKFVDTSLNN